MCKVLVFLVCVVGAGRLALAQAAPDTSPLGKTPQTILLVARQLHRSGQSRAAQQLLQAGMADRAQSWDQAQLAGALDLLTQIHRDCEHYAEALQAALRYQQLLDQVAASDSALVAKRQEICLLLADIYQALGRQKQAREQLQRAWDMSGGARRTDPLWEARVRALEARVAAASGDPAGRQESQALWNDMEGQTRRVLRDIDAGSLRSDFQAPAILLLVDALIHTQRPQPAIAELDRLRTLLPDRSPTVVQTLADIAARYEQLHAYAQERSALQAALDLMTRKESQKSTLEYAELLERLGTAQQQLVDHAAATHAWEEAGRIYQDLSEQKVVDYQGRADQARANLGLQRIWQRLERWPEAIRCTKLLLDYRTQVLPADHPDIWRARLVLAGFYSKVDDLPAAKSLLVETLQYWKSHQPPAWSELAGTLSKLAEVARAEGALTEALAYLEEALPVYRQLYDAGDLRMAELYANLAGLQSAKGQYKSAIDNYREAVKIFRREAGKADPRADELLSATLLNMAMLFKSQRQFREAATHCREALDVQLRIASKDDQSTLPFYLALTSLHLAQDKTKTSAAKSLSGDLRQARQYADEAQRLCETFGLEDKATGAAVLQLQGMIHMRTGEWATAQRDFERARKIALGAHQPALEAKCLTYLAEVALSQGALADGAERLASFERAADLSSRALELHNRLQTYPNLHFMAYLSLARAERGLEHGDAALEALRKAVQLIEAPRASTVGAESERAEFFSQYAAAFDLLVDWNVSDGHLDEALAAAESGRNRTFLDQVRSAGIDVRASLKGTPQEGLLQQERDVSTDYNLRVKDLRQAYAAGAPALEINKLVAQIDALRQKYAGIQTDIRDASPLYRNFLGKSSTSIRWSDIAAGLLTPDNVLVLYYLGHAKSHLFVIDGRTHAIHHFPLEVSPDQAARLGIAPGALTRGMVARLANPYLAVLRDRNQEKTRGIGAGPVVSIKGENDAADRHVDPLNADQQIAFTELVLPRPARDKIISLAPDYACVVPDGALDQLPLEALLLKDSPPRYLFDDFPPIAYAPSARILEMLISRAPASGQLPISLLTVGDPHYPLASGDRSRTSGAGTSAEYQALGGLLTALPATREECENVKRAIEASSTAADVAMLTGDDATEGNVRGQIQHRRFIHLAAHGLVDQRFDNQFGAIALTPPKVAASSNDDGFLSLYEIHNLSLTACELVVLSACETKVGTDRPLEAGSTLARAFLAAGARDVISSHWNVDDVSTARLMSTFFSRVAVDIKHGRPAHFARALHAARGELRHDSKFSAPYFWAPFVLVGPAQ